MGFSDNYRRRVATYGNNESEAIQNSTFETVNNSFTNAPNYRVVQVDGQDFDVRILDGKTDGDKKLLLRPQSKIPVGSYVEYDNKFWLVFDLNGELFSPKATIESCNEIMKWKDASGVIHEYNTLATATRNTKFDIVSDKMQVEMLQAGIYAYIPYNEFTKTIRASMRFIFGNSVYEITGVDDLTMVDVNRVGLMQLSCRVTTSTEGDDFTTRIANNDVLHVNENGSDGSGGGGGLW